MIGHKNTKVLWHQSEARTIPAVWNWSVKNLSPGALLVVLDFSTPEFFSRPFRLFPAPTNCPWVSEDGLTREKTRYAAPDWTHRFSHTWEKRYATFDWFTSVYERKFTPRHLSMYIINILLTSFSRSVL